MYDLRLIGKPEIWKLFALPASAYGKLNARLIAAERDARREVPDLPPLSGEDAIYPSVVQEHYRLMELNAAKFGEAFGRWVQKHTLAFLFEYLTAVQRVRAMQSMNQIAGPSPKLLKVIGLSEEESGAYIKELIAMRQQAIKEHGSDDVALFRKVAAGVKDLNKKHFSKAQGDKWSLLTGLEIRL